MGFILGIDTTDRMTYAAVVRDGVCAAEAARSGEGAVESLSGLISDVLASARVELNAINAIAVAAGPGSFTGIRTGLATSQGLAAALDLPVICISTLLARVAAAVSECTTFVPWMPANRNEVYAAAFELEPADGGKIRSRTRVSPVACSSEELHSMTGAFGEGIRVSVVPAPGVNAAAVLACAADLLIPGSEPELQTAPCGIGLHPIYAKGANAKTLAERSALA